MRSNPVDIIDRMGSPLWTPSAERIERSRLTQFMRHVVRRWNVDVPDYAALYEFSISRPLDFWISKCILPNHFVAS